MGAKLKGLRRFEQDGVAYTYHRATGIRLPSGIPETHPDFLRAYLKAENSSKNTALKKCKAAPKAGTLLATWRSYVRSDGFKSLSSGYRSILHSHADKIMATGGNVPIGQIGTKHIRKDMAELTTNPARQRLKTWRAIMAFAASEGDIEDDPSRVVNQRKTREPIKHLPWSPENVAAFRRHWPTGTQQRLALEVLHYTGARLSDCIRLGPGMVSRDGWLSFTQQKTGGDVSIPFDRALPNFTNPEDFDQLKQSLDARKDRHMTWLTTIHGSARSEKAASNWFSDACRKAGLKGPDRRTAHGLRSARAIRLAEGGATPHQIGAWTGHESLKEIEEYTRGVSRKKLLSGTETRTQIVQVKKS